MKLTLGTAQLGLPKYGRTNATGCPPEADAIALIHAAIEGGVQYIDCARAYGLAEERVGKAVVGGQEAESRGQEAGGRGQGAGDTFDKLSADREQAPPRKRLSLTRFDPISPVRRSSTSVGGSPKGESSISHMSAVASAKEDIQRSAYPISPDLTVITKLSPLAWLAEDASPEVIRAAVEASVYQSCHNLRVDSLPVLMLHRWAHHDSHGGQIWEILLELKAKGVIGVLGASVYTPDEAVAAMSDPAVAHLQIPFNLLDQRWLAPDFQTAKTKRPDLTVHVRSAYLQGVLLSGPETWPKKDAFDATAICEKLDTLVRGLDRQSRADLCLAYLNSCPFVDSILVGVETIEQLRENLKLFELAPLSVAQRSQIESSLSDVPPWLLNPVEW